MAMAPEKAKFDFSVIIPTYNRPQALSQCLDALTRLEYAGSSFEVIVVDDGGVVSLEPVLQPFQSRASVTLLRQANAGPAAARNNGARHARGEYLVFTDDDCTPMPDWLQKLAESFRLYPDAVLGGKTVNVVPRNLYSAASQLLMDFLYTFYNAVPDQALFFASNNIAVPTASFLAIGGFSGEYRRAGGEDRAFCRQLRQHGARLVYAPEAIVRHRHDLTITGFLVQQFTYGRGASIFHRPGGEGREGNGYSPSLSFYLQLMAYPVTAGQRGERVPLTLLILLSQAAVAAGRLWQRLAGH
jgi:GT2 family glycosyltransferase